MEIHERVALWNGEPDALVKAQLGRLDFASDLDAQDVKFRVIVDIHRDKFEFKLQ